MSVRNSCIFLLIAGVWLACSTSSSPAENPPPAEGKDMQRLFIGTSTGDSSQALYTVSFSLEDGSFAMEAQTVGVRNPSFLTLSPDRRFLYCINSEKGEETGRVSAFAIDTESGGLTYINHQSTTGRGPCYVSIDEVGKYVFVANYSSGSVAVFPIGEDGGLQPASDSEQHEGSGPNEQRQKGPHAHYFAMGPDGRAYAPDLGIDRVMAYNFDPSSGQLTTADPPALELEPGAGPRHMDFSPDGKYIYVLNELMGSVSVFDAKGYARLQTISTLPENFDGYNKSADIHVHPNGKFVYASNRGDANSIAVFAIDSETGLLTFVQRQGEGIAWPRNFGIDPTGSYLIACNRDDNDLKSYLIDSNTGELSPTGQRIEIPKPMCVKWQ